jgi:hypothetical protein
MSTEDLKEKVAIAFKSDSSNDEYSLSSELCFEPNSEELKNILIDLNATYGEGTFFTITEKQRSDKNFSDMLILNYVDFGITSKLPISTEQKKHQEAIINEEYQALQNGKVAIAKVVIPGGLQRTAFSFDRNSEEFKKAMLENNQTYGSGTHIAVTVEQCESLRPEGRSFF